jgi:hypothetical protein
MLRAVVRIRLVIFFISISFLVLLPRKDMV